MLTVAVLHYNHNELTGSCCQSVEQQDFTSTPVEYLILDNGSSHPFPGRDGWRVVRYEKNRGNIAGQNLCFQEARGDWMLWLSNDVRLLDEAIHWLWQYKFLGQLMPLILNPGDYTVQSSGGDYWWPGYGLNRTSASPWMLTDYCPSIVYLMPKSLWSQAGGFDESLPMAYEDVDFGRQVETRCIDKAKVLHLGNATLQYTKKDQWRFHQARLQVVRKHYSGINRWIRLNAIHCLDTCREKIL